MAEVDGERVEFEESLLTSNVKLILRIGQVFVAHLSKMIKIFSPGNHTLANEIRI